MHVCGRTSQPDTGRAKGCPQLSGTGDPAGGHTLSDCPLRPWQSPGHLPAEPAASRAFRIVTWIRDVVYGQERDESRSELHVQGLPQRRGGGAGRSGEGTCLQRACLGGVGGGGGGFLKPDFRVVFPVGSEKVISCV